MQGPCFFDREFIVFSPLSNAFSRSVPAKLLLSALCTLLHHGSPEPRQRWSSHAPIETCASFFFTFILCRIPMRFLSLPGRRDRWILWGFSHKTRMSEPVVAFLPVQGPCFLDRLFIVFSPLLNAFFRSGPAKLLLSALCNLPTLATQSPDKERPVTPR